MGLFVHAVARAPASRARTRTGPGDEHVVWLDEPRAADPALAGAKAANLARARAASLPVLRGFAITTTATIGGALDPDAVPAVRAAWRSLSEDGQVPLVVRSSSTMEDTSSSSMAGQFTSVLGVRAWGDVLEAISTVLRSAVRPADPRASVRPMAVLVQPVLDAECGGVLFGLDPVSGDPRRVVVEVVPGAPDALVSGRVTAERAVLGRRGRLLVDGGGPELRTLLDRSRRRRLHRLARAAGQAFAGPQDVEWAVDRDDRLWLLQSRAVTATGDAVRATGPILGPGPVAETFPEPLHPLEVDLWVDPLRRGIAGALEATGAQPRRRIERSPVVCVVGGRVAVDLELFRIAPPGGIVRQSLHPVQGIRRLAAAWRVGRIRAVLPDLVGDLTARVDSDLIGVPELELLDDHQLVDILEHSLQELVALHGHEVLAGMLLEEPDQPSLPSTALGRLARCRAAGLDDDEAIGQEPVVLALTPPAIGHTDPLPGVGAGQLVGEPGRLDDLGRRDSLRLRCRWVQELSGRAAIELGHRLATRGHLAAAADIRALHLSELRAALLGDVPADLADRLAVRPGAPLPVAFRLAPSQLPVATAPVRGRGRDGLPASGGRGSGHVCHTAAAVMPGSVLVTDTLDPRLAAVLPDLAALVSETGSALSHLAILAREMRVPAVVAVPDARRRFPEGTNVVVDGDIGEIHATAPGGGG